MEQKIEPNNEQNKTVPESSSDFANIKEGNNSKLDDTESQNLNKENENPSVNKVNKWSRQEKISVAGILVSFLAFCMALYSVKQTVRSVNISDSSFQINKLKDIIANQRYEIENVPYLQIGGFSLAPITTNETIRIRFSVSNLNKYPAKIVDSKCSFYLGTDSAANPFQNISNLKGMTFFLNSYVIKEAPQVTDFVGIKHFAIDEVEKIRKGEYLIYFFGEIYYIDQVTLKKRKYRFHVCFYPTIPVTYKMLDNDNTQVD